MRTERKSQDYDPFDLIVTAGEAARFYTCRGCQSVTNDMARHDRWHLKLEDRHSQTTLKAKELTGRINKLGGDLTRVNTILGRLGRK